MKRRKGRLKGLYFYALVLQIIATALCRCSFFARPFQMHTYAYMSEDIPQKIKPFCSSVTKNEECQQRSKIGVKNYEGYKRTKRCEKHHRAIFGHSILYLLRGLFNFAGHIRLKEGSRPTHLTDNRFQQK